MNTSKFNLDTFKSALTANQVLSTKDIQSLKGGATDPPPFGTTYRTDPPPFGTNY